MKLVCNLLITLASYLDLFFAHDISLLRVKTDKIKYDEVAISVTKRKLFGSYINKIMEILITTNISSIKFAFVIITLLENLSVSLTIFLINVAELFLQKKDKIGSNIF